MKPLLAALTILLAAEQAKAEIICFPTHKEIVAKLSERFQETPVWIGTSSNSGAFLELLINAETGTWTVIGRLPASPQTCIVDAGKDANMAPMVERPMGDPS